MRDSSGRQKPTFQIGEILHRRLEDQRDDPFKFKLVRVGPKGIFGGVVASEYVLGVKVHWWDGRTTPCTGEKCEACGNARATTEKGYLWVWNPKKLAFYIFELPNKAAREIVRWVNAGGLLLGSELRLQRPKGTQRSAITVDLVAAPAGFEIPAKPPLLIEILEAIWNSGRPRTREEQARTRPGYPPVQIPTNGERA